MAQLDDRIRGHLVQALACFDTPTQVAGAVKEEFGLTLTRQQVQAYDPTKHAGRTLAKKWRALFDETRKKFLEEAAQIPIAQQSYRLRKLQQLADLAINRNNAPLAAQLLEQAAKEVGGAFTNRRELGGPGGGPIPVKGEHVHTLSDADLERIASAGRGGS
jgi:hypothetical protein